MRYLILAISISLTVLFLPQLSATQSFEAGGSIAIVTANDNLKGGVGFGVHLDYVMPKLVLFRTSVGWYGTDTKVDMLSEGDYSLLWIEESILIRGRGPVVRPYGGGGVGYYQTDHELSSNAQNALLRLGLRGKEEIDNVFGIHVRGGVNVVVSPRVCLNVDGKYAFIKPKVKATVTDLSTYQSAINEGKIDLGALFFNVGLTASF